MRTWSAVRSRRWACSWEASWSTDSPRLSPTQISGDTLSSASRFWPRGALCSRTSTRTSLPACSGRITSGWSTLSSPRSSTRDEPCRHRDFPRRRRLYSPSEVSGRWRWLSPRELAIVAGPAQVSCPLLRLARCSLVAAAVVSGKRRTLQSVQCHRVLCRPALELHVASSQHNSIADRCRHIRSLDRRLSARVFAHEIAGERHALLRADSWRHRLPEGSRNGRDDRVGDRCGGRLSDADARSRSDCGLRDLVHPSPVLQKPADLPRCNGCSDLTVVVLAACPAQRRCGQHTAGVLRRIQARESRLRGRLVRLVQGRRARLGQSAICRGESGRCVLSRGGPRSPASRVSTLSRGHLSVAPGARWRTPPLDATVRTHCRGLAVAPKPLHDAGDSCCIALSRSRGPGSGAVAARLECTLVGSHGGMDSPDSDRHDGPTRHPVAGPLRSGGPTS